MRSIRCGSTHRRHTEAPRRTTLIAICLASIVLVTAPGAPAQAQVFFLPGLGPAAQDKPEQTTDPEQLQQSLDVVIQTLEDNDRRQALLDELKSLRASAAAGDNAAGPSAGAGQGLLGGLAAAFETLGEADSPAESALAAWRAQTGRAADRVGTLLARTAPMHWFGLASGLTVWLLSVFGLARLGRMLFARLGWPLVMPPTSKAWLLLVHFLRRVLPWLLTFIVLLAGLRALDMPAGARSTVLVLAYVAVCGRVLTSLVDVGISLCASGHGRTAVAILRRRALKPLFAVSTMVALSDAVDGGRLTAMLGAALADWLSVAASVTAAVITAWLILRNRRPVAHLFYARPYRQRRKQGWLYDLAMLFARLWHLPSLLAIGASLAAIILAGSQADVAFGKAVVSAVLLVITLALVGALGQQKNRRRPRQHYASNYTERLVRLGYALTQCGIWLAFAETSLRVWGWSLLGVGEAQPISPTIGHSLLGLGITLLLAWLAWIMADTAIERAMRGRRGARRPATARAETVTPMVRNVTFFIILVIAAIAGLANLGVDVTPLLAGAGIIGLAVGFGAQTLVQDLITGIFIVVEDSMAVGDFVEINGYMGAIEGFNLRTVRLRDLDGVVHHITFSHISSIHNMSRQFGIALLKIRIPADMPIDDAVTLMRETAAELRNQAAMRQLIWSPLQMQGIHSFEDGCPVLRMRMRTKPEYQWDVSRAFNLLLKQRMEAQYIDLAAPRLSVSMQADGGERHRGKNQPKGGGTTTGRRPTARPDLT